MKKIEAELARCRYNQRARLDDRREAEFLSSGELPRKIRGDAYRSLQHHLPQGAFDIVVSFIVTTKAHFVEALVSNGRLTPLDQDFESAFFEGAKKTLQRVKFPPLGSERKTVVQPFFDELLPRLCSRQYSPFPNAHAVPTFGTRKPDAAFHLNGRCDSLALVLIGEHKGRSSDGDFSNDEVGHILDMSRDLLENHQVRRHLLYSYLSDGYRFQFFRTDRTENGFVFRKSSLFVGQAGVTVRLAPCIVFERTWCPVSHVTVWVMHNCVYRGWRGFCRRNPTKTSNTTSMAYPIGSWNPPWVEVDKQWCTPLDPPPTRNRPRMPW